MTEEGAARPASREQKTTKSGTPPPPRGSWFRLPTPIRRVFDNFPLVTYASNELPQRTTTGRNNHILYLFQRNGQPNSQPSCNPSCLKYQAYLRFRDINFRSQAANNHASPTGALPFILPAVDSATRPTSPVAANKITRWVVSQGGDADQMHMKEEAYMSLVDHTIRNAWLHYLYLDRRNFRFVAWPLYVEVTSSNPLVQQTIARQLQSAARDELLKTSTTIDSGELYHNADDAFQALSTLLGGGKYFFSADKPGLFDASLFAYTHLVLDESMGWETSTLTDTLSKYTNLVSHRNLLFKQYFGT